MVSLISLRAPPRLFTWPRRETGVHAKRSVATLWVFASSCDRVCFAGGRRRSVIVKWRGDMNETCDQAGGGSSWVSCASEHVGSGADCRRWWPREAYEPGTPGRSSAAFCPRRLGGAEVQSTKRHGSRLDGFVERATILSLLGAQST